MPLQNSTMPLNLSKKSLDHQTVGWSDNCPIDPSYYIEDCRISKCIALKLSIIFINLMKLFTLLSGLLIQVRVCHLVGWITGRRPGHRGLQWTSIHVASSTTVCKEIHIFFTNLFFQLNMFQSKKKLSYKDSSQKTLKESWFGNLPISNEDPIQ